MIKNYPDSEFAEEARQRRDDLDKPASKKFYAWFCEITPPRGQPGTPGMRPRSTCNRSPAMPRREAPAPKLQ